MIFIQYSFFIFIDVERDALRVVTTSLDKLVKIVTLRSYRMFEIRRRSNFSDDS